MKGKLICIEGPDFSGKSTCIDKLKEILPVIYKREKFAFTREPGNLLGTDNAKICEDIRHKLLTVKQNPHDEAQGFALSRKYHTSDIIDLLNRGTHVICDRYFISSFIYQSPKVGEMNVYDMNKEALNMLKMNNIEMHNIVLTLSYDNYKKRSSYRDLDAMEQVPEKVIRRRLGKHKDIDKVLKEYDKDLFKNTHYVDANKHSEHTVMQVLNIIYKNIK